MAVTLIIPTMNEVNGMKWFMPKLKKEWYDELIVIDGGSTDGTVEYCREKGYPIYFQSSARGLSAALVDAFKHTTQDIIITASPDGNSIPELIPELIEKVREGYDMVIVSRYLGLAKSEDDDFFTRFGNMMFTAMINLFFRARYTDTLVIFRAYTRQAIQRMRLDEQEKPNWYRRKFYAFESWELGSAIRAAKLKLKVAQIPGSEPKRIGGQRKLSIVKHGSGALLQVFYELFTGQDF